MSGLALRVVVGLGNPGPEYALTRHNAGFWFVDELARRYDGRLRPERRYGAETARIRVAGIDLWLLKPLTYMNRSGSCIRAFCDYLRIPVAEVLVAHDDLDLPPGTVRLKRGGGAGGHNGLKDTITHLGEDFWRLRLGIGHPGQRDEVIDYVLRRAGTAEQAEIETAVVRAVEEFPRLIEEGAQRVMNRLHSAPAGSSEPGEERGDAG